MSARRSLAAKLAALPHEERQRIWHSLSAAERQQLAYEWRFWARPEQLAPPGEWSTWLILTGRGWGKNRTGAEWIRAEVESGRRKRLALVARTAADVRDTVVEGESGLLAISPPGFRPEWEPSKRRLTWPNGAIGTTYTADEPDALRGPQHDGAWCDELASWRAGPEAWSNLMMGLRLGRDPRVVVTTTPRPVKLVKDLLADPHTVVTRGRTYDNLENLAPTFQRTVIARYVGTRLGRQELEGLVLEDAQGALWKRDLIEAHRVAKAPELRRIVVALDPSGTSGADSDECGIGVAALGADGHGYVLDDRSGVMSPAEWGKLAVSLYHMHSADRIVAEANFGGDMCEQVIRGVRDAEDRPVGASVPYKKLTASRGKAARAEPVAALYEQGRVHHVGVFAELEDELCSWEPNSGQRSPNRLDWLVWALTELMLGDGGAENWLGYLSAEVARQRGEIPAETRAAAPEAAEPATLHPLIEEPVRPWMEDQAAFSGGQK
ncbi:MAG: terminase family protein [Acidobacteriia bacterium]|nr:terminase family protein [Terriglobia bacterium]